MKIEPIFSCVGLEIDGCKLHLSPIAGDMLWRLMEADGKLVPGGMLPGKNYASQRVTACYTNEKLEDCGVPFRIAFQRGRFYLKEVKPT